MQPNYFVTEKDLNSRWASACLVMWVVGTISSFFTLQSLLVLNVARTGCLVDEMPLASETTFMVMWMWLWTCFCLLFLVAVGWGFASVVLWKVGNLCLSFVDFAGKVFNHMAKEPDKTC
jgi:hypothetical protein